jgi:hypothetical protein
MLTKGYTVCVPKRHTVDVPSWIVFEGSRVRGDYSFESDLPQAIRVAGFRHSARNDLDHGRGFAIGEGMVPHPPLEDVMEAAASTPRHARVRVLWRFTDQLGRSTVCRVIELVEPSVIKLRLDHNGYAVITETHPTMAALERRSREYYERAVAEGWTEVRDTPLMETAAAEVPCASAPHTPPLSA